MFYSTNIKLINLNFDIEAIYVKFLMFHNLFGDWMCSLCKHKITCSVCVASFIHLNCFRPCFRMAIKLTLVFGGIRFALVVVKCLYFCHFVFGNNAVHLSSYYGLFIDNYLGILLIVYHRSLTLSFCSNHT